MTKFEVLAVLGLALILIYSVGATMWIICPQVLIRWADYFGIHIEDKRQDYQLVYQNLKRLVRKATMVGCNVIFTAWLDISEITTADGERTVRYAPKLPNKILDNVCGLCNVIAYVDTTEDKNGNKIWFYRLEGNNSLYAKDQLYCRKVCKPENIFEQEAKSK